MKTIFVTLPTGWAIRNFLSTGLLTDLSSSPKNKIIVFVGKSSLTSLKKQFENDNLQFEELPKIRKITPATIAHKALRIRFKNIHYLTYNRIKNRKVLSFWQHILDTIFGFPFRGSNRAYKLLRKLIENTSKTSGNVDGYYLKYSPDMLFTTQPIDTFEMDFLKSADKFGVKTVSMIRSWDELLTKGYLPVMAQHYLVWNAQMKQKLIDLYDIAADKIEITGAPQFDIYFQKKPTSSKEDFCHNLGISPSNKIILFATSPPLVAPQEPVVVNKLWEQLEAEEENNYSILVKIHPQDRIERFNQVAKPGIILHEFRNDDNSQENNFLEHPGFLEDLFQCLYHSDIVVNTFSTMTIDSSAVDRPVINVAFDVEKVDWSTSTLRFLDSYEHLKVIWDTQSAAIANNMTHLVSLIDEHTKNPSLNQENRKRLVKLICHKSDGLSSKRVIEAIVRLCS